MSKAGEKRKAKRCSAKSRVSGKRCGQNAVKGKSVCYYHGGAEGSGAQPGNTNALKHGAYSQALAPEDREYYEACRVQPRGLDDHIALLETKVYRYVRFDNPDFNFDQWKDEIKQEFTGTRLQTLPDGRVVEREIKVTTTKKLPLGPDLLIKMLGELRKLYWTKHQIETGGAGPETEEGRRIIRMPLGGAMPARKDKANGQRANGNGDK